VLLENGNLLDTAGEEVDESLDTALGNCPEQDGIGVKDILDGTVAPESDTTDIAVAGAVAITIIENDLELHIVG
jgi:hypothetical protein